MGCLESTAECGGVKKMMEDNMQPSDSAQMKCVCSDKMLGAMTSAADAAGQCDDLQGCPTEGKCKAMVMAMADALTSPVCQNTPAQAEMMGNMAPEEQQCFQDLAAEARANAGQDP